MRAALRTATATAFLGAALLATPLPAGACSMVPPAFMEEVEALLTGSEYDGDRWLPEDAVVIGFVEYTVVHEWEATLDYDAASAQAATRVWGTVDGRNIYEGIRGGEPRGPMVSFNTCGPSLAEPVGRVSYHVVLDNMGTSPVDGVLKADIETLLTSTFGEPAEYDAPEFDDRHPGYDRPRSGWSDYLTWGRIVGATSALVFIPVAGFAAWVYSTRRG